MATPKTSVQTATQRREAQAKVRALIATLAPTHQRLLASLRRSLLKHLPAAHELVYEYRDCLVISYTPSERGHEGVLAIRAAADGVKLYFNRGKGLPDPEKLLRGSGGLARWMGVESAATLARPAVASLIAEALARNPVPFARSGRGSVVIRPTAAKERRERRPAQRTATGTKNPARTKSG